MKAKEKAIEFLKASMKCYDKKIAIPSNQSFCITELVEERDNLNHKSGFAIQYGFPSSGAVCLNFTLDRSKGKFHATITKFIVHAQSADKSLIVANYSSQGSAGLPELGASIQFGLNTNTVKYSNYEEIDKNPNALQMIDMAINDLNNALVLEECRVCYEKGANLIPCCETAPYPEKEDKIGNQK